jgi:hypothetical protein
LGNTVAIISAQCADVKDDPFQPINSMSKNEVFRFLEIRYVNAYALLMRAQENVWYPRFEVSRFKALVPTLGLKGATAPEASSSTCISLKWETFPHNSRPVFYAVTFFPNKCQEGKASRVDVAGDSRREPPSEIKSYPTSLQN